VLNPFRRIFPLTPDKGAVMLRFDLERAGIPYRDRGKLVFDFHALRCQCATLADAAWVTPRVVQKLMRHSTLELTGRYTRPRAVDIEKAAETFPSLRPGRGQTISSSVAATGTEDSPAHRQPSEAATQPTPIPDGSGTEVQPISEVFAHLLPTEAVSTSPNQSHSDAITRSSAHSKRKRSPSKKGGPDSSGRPLSQPVVSTGVGTRTPDLRIMRRPATCDLKLKKPCKTSHETHYTPLLA
jgi:hypothetical protein